MRSGKEKSGPVSVADPRPPRLELSLQTLEGRDWRGRPVPDRVENLERIADLGNTIARALLTDLELVAATLGAIDAAGWHCYSAELEPVRAMLRRRGLLE